jgi:hypothetical protein
MKMKTIVIAVLVIAAAIVGYYYYNSKKTATLTDADPSSPFDVDDTTAYKQMRSLVLGIDPGAVWLDAAVKGIYDRSPDRFKLQGKPKSKAGAYLEAFEAGIYNEAGKYAEGTDTVITDTAGGESTAKRWLWPESIHKQLWSIWQQMEIKYGGF